MLCHLLASSALLTMGSPFMLRLVLSSIGQPVNAYHLVNSLHKQDAHLYLQSVLCLYYLSVRWQELIGIRALAHIA